MHRHWLFLFITIFWVGCAPANPARSPEPSITPTPTTASDAPIDAETEALAAEFIALRSVPGQFNGGAWNADVDQWEGPKHTVMRQLADRLVNGRYTCTQLTNLLQPPDHTVQGGDPLHDLIQASPIYETIQAEADQFLVYEWRGTHDFLFFVCADGRITAADWWYAGE